VAEDGPRQVAGVAEGQILAGKYRVERVLGVGGMGVVVAAHHIGLDEKVAIKFLLPEMLSNAEAVNRFAREARNAVKIKGEHMARVFDVGTLETGAPYMVMEFLEGGDLHAWLKQRGPLPVEEAVDFVLQTCEVIAEAHSLGIIHRDLKPANLFCVRRADGRLSIKVLDFGISKVTRLGGSLPNLGMTSTGALMGSPFYMSPEQMESSNTVDTRTDIWALGIIIQELVTGKVPFPGATMPEVSIKVASRPPPPLREFRPDAPEGLQVVVSRCLEKDRERRYRNVAELATDLLPFAPKRAKASVERITDIIQASGLSASALSLPPSSEPTSQPRATETLAPFGGTAAGTRGSKRTVVSVVIATGTLAIAAVVSLAFMTRGPTAPTTQTEHPDGPSSKLATAQPPLETPPTSSQTAPPLAAAVSSLPRLQEPTPEPSHPVGKAPASTPTGQPTGRPNPTPTAALTAAVSAPRQIPSSPQGVGLPTSTATLSPPPPRPAAAQPDCDPNYTIDPKSGAHLFKPECFAK
jgi:serine/threonine-protein kinase